MKIIKQASIAIVMMFMGTSAFASWTDSATLSSLNVGGNGLHATFITLSGVTFSGCAGNTSAIVKIDNANYSEIVATLMAAHVSNFPIKIGYSGCYGNYSIVQEVSF